MFIQIIFIIWEEAALFYDIHGRDVIIYSENFFIIWELCFTTYMVEGVIIMDLFNPIALKKKFLLVLQTLFYIVD